MSLRHHPPAGTGSNRVSDQWNGPNAHIVDGPGILLRTDAGAGPLALVALSNDFAVADGALRVVGAHQLVLTAATALGGHRVVIADAAGQARYPDRTNIAHADAVIGLTVTAASAGTNVTVQTTGDVVESSWNWTPGPVWVGDNGLPTQTPPTTGWLQLLGVALGSTRLVLTPRQAVLLQ